MTTLHRAYRLAAAICAAAIWTLPTVAAAQQRVGVNAAVNTDATGLPPGGMVRKLVIGQEVVHNERITTDTKGQTQILFLDGSSVSVGPNADLLIDEFVYDPSTGTGKMSLTVVQGAMRFIGGKLSKQENAVTVRVGTSIIGVRGGVFVADVQPGGKTEVIFVFGKELNVAGQSGCAQDVYRPGFEVDISGSGGCPNSPHQAPPGATEAILGQLDGRSGGNGGVTTVPTDATIASSLVPNTISNNIQASVQQAAQNSAPAIVALPTPTVSPPQVPTNQIQVASSQSQPVAQGIPQSPPPPPPPPPPSVTETIAGAAKLGKAGQTTGLAQVGDGFNSATLSYPSAALQNGTASLTAGVTTSATNVAILLGNTVYNIPTSKSLGNNTGSATATLTGLTAGTTSSAALGLSSLNLNGVNLLTGSTTFGGLTDNNGLITVDGITVNLNQIVGALATGNVTVSPDGNFFYADLFLNDPALASLDPSFTSTSAYNTPIFVTGGTPVAQSFYTATSPAPQFYAFTVQPDFTLGNGSQGQTIPFLPSFSGGTMSGATVSPLLAVQNANAEFGAYNPIHNANVLGTPYLQASLAINGTGLNQSSALVVSTGGFSTSSDNAQVTVSGSVRGTVFTGATQPLIRVDASTHSVTDGNGNSLFGASSIDGFVLDQNENNLTNNFVPNSASSSTYQSGSGFTTTSYNFNQPVTATTVPTGIGAARSALNETGYFGGAMQCCSTNSTTDAIINYGLAGTVSLQTDPTTSRVAATFSSNAPFIATAPSGQSPLNFSGLDRITLQFGSLPSAGANHGRSTFLDNSDYAALESPDTSSTLTRTISGVPTSFTLPTATSTSNSSYEPQLALVTSSLVPNTTLLPGGQLCACQYEQWGYWTGRVQSPNSNNGYSAGTTSDIASINTWIAGTPTVTMPTVGVGNYSGNAIGTVYNNGAQYLAVGGVLASYNFAANIGTLTISNFDGNTFGGILSSSSGSSYTTSLTGSNLSGFANGTFYGPNAVETGGNFGVQAPAGTYFASGIYDAASTGVTSTLPAFALSVSGLAKSTDSPPTDTGFSDQSTTDRIPYSGATISYPAGSVLQNGMLSATLNGLPVTLGPLTPGATTSVTATSANGSSSGTATVTADSDFFYANLLQTTGHNPGELEFVFGGVPVNQNFYAPQATTNIQAFQVLPDAALGNGTQAQTIPFLPANFGGTMANASVSDFYLTTGANSPFGFGSSTANIVTPKWLQASLAFNGTGANQTSALTVLTGSFFEDSQTNGSVVAGGSLRSTVMLSATASPVKIEDGLTTVPDGAGNNLFGASTLDGFVLDQNYYGGTSGAFTQALATASQFGQSNFNYAFNQPVIATSLPANAGDTRQALNETGYFGGLMTFSANTSLAGNPYALAGTTAVQTTLSNNRIAATFTGSDPFTAAQSQIHSMVLAFGSTNGDDSASFGTYVNNTVYAALDSPDTQSSINGNKLPLLANSTNSNPSPRIAMVTSGTVPTAINAILPTGVNPCTCEYLQWGYWTGQAVSTTSQGLGVNRTDRAFINTWLAGQPTVTMPTSGVGTYSGAAVGTVFNNGATYVAAGGFSQSYNFGNNTGVVNISNFDGASYTASVNGSGRTYSGTLTGVANRTGSVNGGFFGPNAVETGGNFGIQSMTGPRYIASGIFAGR